MYDDIYNGSTPVNMILYYGSLTVPSIVPHGVRNPGMVNGTPSIILPTPDLGYKYTALVPSMNISICLSWILEVLAPGQLFDRVHTAEGKSAKKNYLPVPVGFSIINFT